jgi:hypothetical protein
MTTLEDIMLQFAMSVRCIKQSMQFRAALDSPQCQQALFQITRQLAEAEAAVDRLQLRVAQENSAIARTEQLMETIQAQSTHCQYISDHLPTHLPTAPKRGAAKQPLRESHTSNTAAATHSTAMMSKQADALPAIAVVRVDEFDSTPAYIKGRIGRDLVNTCVEAIQNTLASKYKLLGMTRSKLGTVACKRFDAYKDAETDETRHMVFFVEDDLKTTGNFKLDTAGRACLNVLRHLGRLREHRSNGYVRYVVA